MTSDATVDVQVEVVPPPPTCESGFHLCERLCEEDRDNEPELGCGLGCGVSPCAAPLNGVATCTPDGRCSFRCTSPFRRDGENCVCTPFTCSDLGYVCGEAEDGCGGTLSCGTCASGTCLNGLCGCGPDSRESNNTDGTAQMVVELNDADDAELFVRNANLHDSGDVDWYRFPVRDGNDFGNPKLTVELSGVPEGADYQLGAWFVCNDGGNDSNCQAGTVDNLLGNGCVSTAAGSADEQVRISTGCSGIGNFEHGNLFVRVTSQTHSASCVNYVLRVAIR